ncbi:MAG: HNH endonuclease [Candidatus Hydrogenedentes bacterium]|nr:HNH endonuclease [Candidatus Hydrogenedentota bacterium]
MIEEKIFSFDLGTGSIAYCIRQGSNVLALGVDEIPSDFSALKEVRARRRQIRTRLAHKAREEWWKKHAREAGLEVLETGRLDENGNFIPPDPRLVTEFTKPGDPTIYNSYLLRIALLQGKDLESWQIFKAIWSAIQHRGYEPPPWTAKEESESSAEQSKSKSEDKESKKEEKEIRQAVENYRQELKNAFGDKEEYYYPCYLEAYRLGIWSTEDPDNLTKTINENPQPIRNRNGKIQRIIPRELLEKEIKQLLHQAGKKYPYLERNLSVILYGPAGVKYPAYTLKEYRRFMGKDWEWQGLLSQKTPRFDNRIISKCRFIPRLNVCKRKDELAQEVTFLMKLKNLRFVDSETGEIRGLTPAELRDMFDAFKQDKKIGKKALEKYLKEKLNARLHPSHREIDPPKTTGRASFCRPVLRILKEILLSGKSPHQLYQEYINANTNTNPLKGLVNEDYKFLLELPEEWDNFYIPDRREEEANFSEEERLEKINKIFSKITNAVVRHRLILFYNKLREFRDKYGEPDKVIFEFARDPEETLETRNRKEMYKKVQKFNLKAREAAKKILQELREKGTNLEGKDRILKIRLWKEQSGVDPYTGENIGETEISLCEIDHIVPREMGGPDARYNMVLTKPECNREKGKRTPYQWLGQDPEKWKVFIDRIGRKFKQMSDRKKALLTSQNPEELVEKYTHLAETSYISRLAQKIVHLFFGWEQLTEGSKRRVFVVSGAFTKRIRDLFQLDPILYPHLAKDEVYKISSEERERKNRDNPRHHALDALVVSITQEIKYNPQRGKDDYPDWFTYDYCKEVVEKCLPVKVRFEKPTLAETIYGLRPYIDDDGKPTGEYVFVTRFGEGTNFEDYAKLDHAKKNVDSIYSYNIRRDLKKKLDENPSKEEWEVFIHNYLAGGKPKKLLMITSSKSDKGEIERFLKGETKNFGEFIRGKMPGQFLKQDREARGYFVYKDQKGKWKREIIYAFESPFLRKREILSRLSSTEDIYFFRSGMLVRLENDIVFAPRGKEEIRKIPKGYYYLNTIIQGGSVKITSMEGKVEILTISRLMEEGKMRPAQPVRER